MVENARDQLLAEVVERYLGSGDFNGLVVGAGDTRRSAAEQLVRDGLIEVIAEEDFPNPHIRPWASRRSMDEQVASLAAAIEGDSYGICLYPLSAALTELDEVRALVDRPYTQRLAAGAGQLDVAFFRMDVLESYRNDPRFTFLFNDFGARASVADAVYADESEAQADKVSISLGFAYREPLSDDEPIVRLVAAFLRDLARLSPEHQRRWETYEVVAEDGKPHPIWLAEAMGHWIDRIGPFDALFAELAALDELYERAFGTPLLRTTERPSDFGWILRPSQMEFDNFVQTLDKLLSENLRHDAFGAADIPKTDEAGQPIGTLNRLNRLLERARVPEDQRKDVMQPLRDVRSARGKPAHALRQNVSDANFVRRQAELLRDVTNSIEALRRFWQTHPRNREWEPPPELVTAKRLWL
jgi:hypothetical protein